MIQSNISLYKIASKIDADIYQISEPELVFLGVLLKLKKKFIIYNMRENYISLINLKKYIPIFFKKSVSFIYKLITKQCLLKYDHVFSVTEDIDNEVRKWGVLSTSVVKNFPTLDFFNNKISFEEYIKRDNIICYFGTVYRISNQDNIIKAINDIDNLKYWIAGRFEDSSYKTKISKENKVIITGEFDKEMLDFILKSSTISNVLRDFSQTGTPNGSFGIIKMFESMAASLPIICSNVKINEEIIQKYNCGICVDINNVNSIKNAINFLINNKQEAYLMGQNGRKAIDLEYNWEKESLKYLNIINNTY